MQLSNEAYNHVVIFKDKSKKWITDAVYQNLLTIDENGKFSVDGGIYDYTIVSKILTRKEFYNEYPEDRPAIINEPLPQKPVKLNKKRRELLLKGIENAADKNEFYKNVKKKIAKKDDLRASELM